MRHLRTSIAACLPIAMALAVCGITARAALADSPRSKVERSGLTVGLSIGGGGMGKSCESCDGVGSVAAAIRIGWMVTPKLAVLYDASGFAGPVGELNSTSSMVLSGAAQYWVAPRAWLKAGIGVAKLEVMEGVFGQQERSDRGLGVVAAGAYQLATLGRFELELEARTTVGLYQEKAVAGVGALLGLAWY